MGCGEQKAHRVRTKSVSRVSGMDTTNLEARVGFEPTNKGFADLPLRPLGYRAKLLSIAKFLAVPGNWRRTARGLRAIFLQAPAAKRFWLRAESERILPAAWD